MLQLMSDDLLMQIKTLVALHGLTLFLLLCTVNASAVAQDNLHLGIKISGQVYRDRKISVHVPKSWSIAIDSYDDGGGTYRGAILRKGKYILRLCTGCGQVSGAKGGRFSEIAGLVQPWYRVDPGAKGFACGDAKNTQISKRLDRVDFWFQRDPSHTYNEDADDCREPKTTAMVWYGSYFRNIVPKKRPETTVGDIFFTTTGWLVNELTA